MKNSSSYVGNRKAVQAKPEFMRCIVYNPGQGGFVEYADPVHVYSTSDLGAVRNMIEGIAERTLAGGYHAVGFLTYEAAPAFDDSLEVHDAGEKPLLAFGLFDSYRSIDPGGEDGETFRFSDWTPGMEPELYTETIRTIKEHIREGNSYQINFTYQLHSTFEGDPQALFLTFADLLKAEYSVFIEMEDSIICSFSPELFFEKRGNHLISKPMKGTASRGLTLDRDKEIAAKLHLSEKDRAENVMIVDMIRNDVGRIAKTGSVHVVNLFEVERHPYVHQMISTVASECNASFFEILQALFPCASITGAPKVRTMQIIKQLEQGPRGVYTGSIGQIFPDGNMRFNVAIRTLELDKTSNRISYGTGGGIVWDSIAEKEYDETRVKADFLVRPPRRFDLFESLLHIPESGFYLLEYHLKRLADSAEYFGFRFNRQKCIEALEKERRYFVDRSVKVKCILNRTGDFRIEHGSLDGVKSDNLKLGLAREPVHSQNPFLYHKTTRRDVYEKATASAPEFDDILLWNENGEITESCRSNVVIQLGGCLHTPPVSCGLLPGTFRASLLERGTIVEKPILISDLEKAEALFTINSVRKWMRVISFEGNVKA